jgi:hypothetical protein
MQFFASAVAAGSESDVGFIRPDEAAAFNSGTYCVVVGGGSSASEEQASLAIESQS